MRIHILTGIVALFATTAANAVVGGEILYGRQQVAVADDPETSSNDNYAPTVKDTFVGVHVDPVPAVPVAVGFFGGRRDFELDKEKVWADERSYGGWIYGIETFAWLPLSWSEPYARVGLFRGNYDFHLKSSGTDESGNWVTEMDAKATTSGQRLAVGLRLVPSRFVRVLVEYSMLQETVKGTSGSLKLNGEEMADATFHGDSSKSSTKGVLVGLEVGL